MLFVDPVSTTGIEILARDQAEVVSVAVVSPVLPGKQLQSREAGHGHYGDHEACGELERHCDLARFAQPDSIHDHLVVRRPRDHSCFRLDATAGHDIDRENCVEP